MDRSVVINDLSEGWSMGSLISREIAEIGRAAVHYGYLYTEGFLR